MALKTNDYGQELKMQMALKENQRMAEKYHDWVQDFNHLDTIEHYTPYGK